MRKNIKIGFVILVVLGLFFGLGNSFALAESVVVFGGAGDLPVAGDWNGDGKTEVGNYKGNGVWAVDYNGNGAWDGSPTDKIFNFGSATDIPVTGDWNGDGKTEIGNYKGNGVWTLDYNGNGVWDGAPTDKVFNFGSATDIPVTGDWNGDGKTEIGNYKGNGVWALDFNGNGVWDGAPTDKVFNFGSVADQPVTGDWNGDGKTEIGNYKGNGVWALDYNGNGQWDNEPTDKVVNHGIAGDLPVTGDWNGDGKDEPGVYRPSNFSFHLYGPAVAVCGVGAVSGCRVCDASGMAWMDDDSKCASGQKCKNGVCTASGFKVSLGQPYTIGAWYFTAWSSAYDEFIPSASLNLYGRSDIWGGVRDYALGNDPQKLGIDYSNRRPLIGYYDLMDQRIMDTHIQQAASRGLSYFAFYWWWNTDKNMEMGTSAPLHKFVSSSQKGKMKFLIAPGVTGNAPLTLEMWNNSIVPYIINNYIVDSSYLATDDGRPIVVDFGGLFKDSSVYAQAISSLKNAVKIKINKEPIILFVSMEQHTAGDFASVINYLKEDGFICFNLAPQTAAEPYSETLSRWSAYMDKQSSYLNIPCATTGYDPRPWWRIGYGWDKESPNQMNYNTGISAYLFQKNLQTVKVYLDSHPETTSKMATVYAWNEWGEGGFIEPDAKQGYAHLDAIKSTFGLVPKNATPSIPSDLAGPSVPQELTIAAASLGKIVLGWKNSTDNFKVSGYKIYRNGVFPARQSQDSQIPGISVTFDDISNIISGKYSYAVSAVDSSNNESAKSGMVATIVSDSAICRNKCYVIGLKQCDSAASYQICQDINHDGCLEWGLTAACASGKTCKDGQCAVSSSDNNGGGNISIDNIVKQPVIPMTRAEILAKIAQIKTLLIQLIQQLIIELQR